jgi:hypothetical protein
MEDDDVNRIKNEYTDVNMRDMIQRSIFFRLTGLPAIDKNIEKDELEFKISKIKEFDPKDCIFPTTQPRIGLTYLEHPIKDNIFIPIDIYDKYIHDEKKGELIAILKNLRANKVIFSISQKKKDQEVQKIFEYIIKNELLAISEEEEIWEFDNSKIDISKFNDKEYIWLGVEEGWKKIVEILKAGGVKKGSISFSSDISALSLTEFQKLLHGRKSIRIEIYKIHIEI